MPTPPDKSSPPFVRWAPATEHLLANRNLSDRELRALLVVMSYDLPDSQAGGNRKHRAFLARSTVARILGCSPRQVSRLLESLESKGFLRREQRSGRASIVHIDPTVYPEPATLVAERQDPLVAECQGSSTPLSSDDKTPLSLSVKGPLSLDVNHKRYSEERIVRENSVRTSCEDSAIAPSNPTPEIAKKKARCKPPSPDRFDAVKAAVEAVDLADFREKYRDLDVSAEYEQWRDYVLYGVNKAGKPPWTLPYTRWDKVFENWLRNVRKWNGNRGTATRTPQTQPVPQLPSLDNFTLD
ncbi:MAG: hypothetical protein AB1646_24430 [Thermodesulfobacteriota bacterium]